MWMTLAFEIALSSLKGLQSLKLACCAIPSYTQKPCNCASSGGKPSPTQMRAWLFSRIQHLQNQGESIKTKISLTGSKTLLGFSNEPSLGFYTAIDATTEFPVIITWTLTLSLPLACASYITFKEHFIKVI
ncbi:hypothetical protein CAPTEDRAFT_185863 [Capitella teleta]|uniref:Uncharacterized protein n=1 Tax=Capitella teleta TaxID=283909 RepID=R7TD43_CAPTE|nr:hypothetical protein CAPTEDRAFT_185863 [Capitella teleta]|eukprot:ELT91663.1 hypothetical protein CAPTEDRAFT_185863 [Capitella teleta]